MFLTRLGFNSKMVVTGDVTQIDLPREQASGYQIGDILKDVEGIEFRRFGGEDVVRHKLVQIRPRTTSTRRSRRRHCARRGASNKA